MTTTISAAEYRALRAPRGHVPIAGTDRSIEVKPVDLINEALAGTIDPDAYDQSVRELSVASRDEDPAAVLAVVRRDPARFAALIDAVVCAGALTPAISAVRQPADGSAIWIGELDFGTKIACLREITRLTQSLA